MKGWFDWLWAWVRREPGPFLGGGLGRGESQLGDQDSKLSSLRAAQHTLGTSEVAWGSLGDAAPLRGCCVPGLHVHAGLPALPCSVPGPAPLTLEAPTPLPLRGLCTQLAPWARLPSPGSPNCALRCPAGCLPTSSARAGYRVGVPGTSWLGVSCPAFLSGGN